MEGDLYLVGDAARCHEDALHEWQAEQLARLGIPDLLAQVFADTVDWHQVADLVARGCSPRLALEIVR